MPRHVRIRLLLAAAIVAIAAAVLFSGERQRSAGDQAIAELQSAEAMLTSMLDQHAGINGYLGTGRSSFLEHYRHGRSEFEAAVAKAREGAPAGEDEEIEAIDRQQELGHRYQEGADAVAADVRSGEGRPARRRAAALDPLVERFEEVNSGFQEELHAERRRGEQQAVRLTVGLIVLLGAAFAALGYLLFERRARREGHRREQHSRFADILQLARTESEAYQVVKRHLERLVPGARATVLNRNNSANRLEARTSLEGSNLSQTLEGAEPEACIAIRGGRPYRGGQAEELMACELCGAAGASTTCVPALVGGEVIGSVLLEHEQPLPKGEESELASSISEAAPIIANLRNLSIAEMRASTDALTGLPNNRSVQETLKRMTAQAGRTMSPLAVILFDLDHFKQINDTHGHSKGDEVLAVVGDVAAANVRASDFVGRYGGEEFLALLPDTDRQGAFEVAEKLRLAIGNIDVPGVPRSVTASFGVAVLPDEAGEPDEIVRVADRALYTAKAKGRDRVETVAGRDSAFAGEGSAS